MLWQHIRYSLRSLAKNPAFAMLAILILALGIGATTAIFSVVNAVLLRPLHYRDPGRLVALSSEYRGRPFATVSLDEVERWRDDSRSLESIGSFVFTALPIRVGQQAQFPVVIAADPELLQTLGVQPAKGRNLAGSGSRLKDSGVIISHRLWTGAFQEDPSIVGRTFTMDGQPAVVSGVLPAGFQFPRSDATFFAEEPDIIQPVANIADGWGRDSTQWFAVGRLSAGVAPGQAESELRAITTNMAASTPSLKGMSVRVAGLGAETTRSVRPALLLTLGISLVLLLIACTNIMNLLFSRAAQRGREMAIRRAVGATVGQMIGQMLTESAVLTFVAGAAGVAIAALTLGGLVRFSPAHLPISGTVEVDGTVLLFAFATCAMASLFAGVLPALHRSRQTDALLAGARTSGRTAILRFQRTLMVAQVALGVALLSAAGLLTHSLFRLGSVDPGFRTQSTVGFELAFPGIRPRQAPPLYDRILTATRETPGVISAGWITNLPPETRAGVFIGFQIVGSKTATRPMGNFQITSEDYFPTAGIPLVRGRDFTSADTGDAPQVAIINETLARQYFPNADPIGQHITTMWEGQSQREIVGILRDTHERGLGSTATETLYVPYRQFALAYGAVVARTSLPPEQVLPAIRQRLAMAAPDVPLTNLTTIAARLGKTLDAPRFYTTIAMACAGMAVLFVTLGLYAVISHGVSRRTAEIGIRMALGAQRQEIARHIIRQGLAMGAAGVALGIGLSLIGTRVLKSLLFEIKPVDPVTLASAAIVVVVVTLAASYVPARRASRVDPMVALRHE